MILRNEVRFKYESYSHSLSLHLFPVSPEELAITWWVNVLEDKFWLSICAPRRSPVLYTWYLGMSTVAAQHVEELSRWKWLPNSAVCTEQYGTGLLSGFHQWDFRRAVQCSPMWVFLISCAWPECRCAVPCAGLLFHLSSEMFWFCSNNMDVVKLEAGCQVFSGLRHKPAYCCDFEARSDFSHVFYSEQRIFSEMSCE